MTGEVGVMWVGDKPVPLVDCWFHGEDGPYYYGDLSRQRGLFRDLVLRFTTAIEDVLRDWYGATGSGLRPLIASLGPPGLTDEVTNDLERIAWVRNPLSHSSYYTDAILNFPWHLLQTGKPNSLSHYEFLNLCWETFVEIWNRRPTATVP